MTAAKPCEVTATEVEWPSQTSSIPQTVGSFVCQN